MNGTQGAITRRMSAVLDGFQEEFKCIYCMRDFRDALEALEEAKRSNYHDKLQALENMLDSRGIRHEKRRVRYEQRHELMEYYQSLIAGADIPDSLEDAMLYALYRCYQEYPAPQEYMERLVNTLRFPEDHWEGDTLRLRILKQFIKYGSYLQDWGFGGRLVIEKYSRGEQGKSKDKDVEKLLAGLDDGIFDVLATATKEQKSSDGKYGLLKMADDLAAGKFRMGGATRKTLYLFAMVYNMTYSPGGEEGRSDPDRDLEKNLFRDYYNNNLMRFLSLDPGEKLSEFESDPSGQSMNYKNFAEMVCLYYIAQTDMEPREKLRRSRGMIDRIKEKAMGGAGRPERGKAPEGEAPPQGETVYYKSRFPDILDLPEQDFEDYISDNYNCDVRTKKGRVGEFQLETEQNTAFQEYREILRELAEENDGSLRSYNYGLWFVDVAGEKKAGLKSFPERWREVDRDRYEQLWKLLEKTNSFIGHTVSEEKGERRGEGSDVLIGALDAASPKEVTRTDILVAFYYLYNALNEDAGEVNFEEVLRDFKGQVDQRLSAAGYQTLSGKNIFDVLVVFSVYARMNI